MELDLGNIVSIIQILSLILLTLGVYPYRIRTKNRNLIMHGFLAITALALNLATVIWVMLPTFGSLTLGSLPVLQLFAVLIHAGVGVVAVVLGFVIVVSWVTHPLGELGCAKTWKLMLPTFLVWGFAVVLGLFIHFFNVV
jgi:hypothetical protein